MVLILPSTALNRRRKSHPSKAKHQVYITTSCLHRLFSTIVPESPKLQCPICDDLGWSNFFLTLQWLASAALFQEHCKGPTFSSFDNQYAYTHCPAAATILSYILFPSKIKGYWRNDKTVFNFSNIDQAQHSHSFQVFDLFCSVAIVLTDNSSAPFRNL
jgi:hypothetical protein